MPTAEGPPAPDATEAWHQGWGRGPTMLGGGGGLAVWQRDGLAAWPGDGSSIVGQGGRARCAWRRHLPGGAGAEVGGVLERGEGHTGIFACLLFWPLEPKVTSFARQRA